MKNNYEYDVCAIILASGFSKRYRGNKLKTEIVGKKIFAYSIDLVSEIAFVEKIVVSNDEEILKYAEFKNIKNIDNPNASVGKSESIKRGLKYSLSKPKGYIFFMCDQPFLTIVSVEKLLVEFQKKLDFIIYPKYDNKRGTPTIFPKKFKNEFFKLERDEGGAKFITKKNSIGIEIENAREGIDIDTYEDYKKLTMY